MKTDGLELYFLCFLDDSDGDDDNIFTGRHFTDIFRFLLLILQLRAGRRLVKDNDFFFSDINNPSGSSPNCHSSLSVVQCRTYETTVTILSLVSLLCTSCLKYSLSNNTHTVQEVLFTT